MQYRTLYQSPWGELLMTADEKALLGLEFVGDNEAKADLNAGAETDVLAQAGEWLDSYFAGREPGFMPPVRLCGSEFQMAVWRILQQIPYGGLLTYGEIARQIAAARGLGRMSAQAVGGAVGRNPIAIIVPCHRVIGAGGKLTGYAGGLARKSGLLSLEGHKIINCRLLDCAY